MDFVSSTKEDRKISFDPTRYDNKICVCQSVFVACLMEISTKMSNVIIATYTMLVTNIISPKTPILQLMQSFAKMNKPSIPDIDNTHFGLKTVFI